MYHHDIPVYARFQWLNDLRVQRIFSCFLQPKPRGRKDYDKILMFRYLIYKQFMSCSYRDLESMGGIDYSTFIKFRKRLITANWFSRMFKSLTAILGQALPNLNLHLFGKKRTRIRILRLL